MNSNAGKIKKGATLLRIAAYLLAVALVFSVVSVLCSDSTVSVRSAEPGVTDLTGFDFENNIAEVANESTDSVFIYPGAFYTPEDFAVGSVTQEGVLYGHGAVSQGDFGTLRLVLRLPVGEVYAISGKSVSYAQRLFIDGKEYSPVGKPGTSADDVIPQSKRYMEGFAVSGGSTEIVIQYSAFVHADGGGLYPLEIGYVRNVVRLEQLKTFRAAAVAAVLVTAALFFLGLFLFFPKGRYFLWFALACDCIALRLLFTSDKTIMFLLPDLDWYLCIRLEFMLTCGMALFSALYISSLFPGASNKWAMRGFTLFCSAYTLFVCLTPSPVFTRSAVFFSAVCAAFGIYLLLSVIVAAARQKHPYPLSRAEQWLLLFGLGVYAAFTALGVYAHQRSIELLGLDFPQMGMMVFLFLNILALALGFARTEQELDKAHRIERDMEETNLMLERLDKLRTDFLANISHEIKTPLAVADGFAQYTLSQINEGTVGEDTKENLRIISSEVNRLSELADVLLRVSADMAWERRVVSVAAVIERAAATCRPILAKNNNRLETRIGDNLPPVRVNGDMIHQVLLNLTVNANRHTRGGVVVISGEVKDGMTAITVSDNGIGIDPDLLPDIFKRRVSGSGGTGLGLAICKEIINTHNGSIDVESTPETGTQVTFTLPCEKESADESNDSDDRG